MHLFAAIVSHSTVTQIAIFGATAAIVWWILDSFARQKPRAEQRLDEFREPNSRKSDGPRDARSKATGAVARVLAKASPTLSTVVFSTPSAVSCCCIAFSCSCATVARPSAELAAVVRPACTRATAAAISAGERADCRTASSLLELVRS